VLDGDNLE
jgi:glycine/D-amino acid oxidase-like deaminating enzyme